MTVAVDGSLNQSINKAQRHYSSLFFLPSLNKTLIAIITVCLIVGISSSINFQSSNGLFAGIFLGVSLFTMNFFSDIVLSSLVLNDPIFEMRRTSVLSLASWLFWFILIVLGVTLDYYLLTSIWWIKMCLFGFSVVLTLRTIVFMATLSASSIQRLVAILIQPFSCMVPFLLFWITLDFSYMVYLPFLVFLPLIAMSFGYLFLHILNNVGKKAHGISSLPLFRAFMLNWVTAQNAPLEAFLEKLGEDTDVEVSMLKFTSQHSNAIIIVPLVHPGPFKNIGSSILPSLLKHAYEKEYAGTACVPLGLLGHECNAASQIQNRKIIDSVLNAVKFNTHAETATPLVRVTEGIVTVSCQIFGNVAFLSFTLAPKTTEDLPQELDVIIREEAKKLGLDNSVLINAHNSLTNTNEIEASLDDLRNAACICLKKAVSQPTFAFKMGAATIYPHNFTLKEGMGEGGITALAIKAGEQKAVYIIIDGNNMISGLREKILAELANVGFNESEVFTTDTHSVSAIVKGQRGYHPVGEVMDHDVLIRHIKEAAKNALNCIDLCSSGFLRIIVPKIRVMGEASLEPLTDIVDKSIRKAKHIAGPIFAIEGLLLIALLTLL
jgi:putative membrane protein